MITVRALNFEKSSSEAEIVSNPFVIGSDSIESPDRMIGSSNYNYNYAKD